MSAGAKSPTGQHQFDWPAGWEWWARGCWYCSATKEDGRDATFAESATAKKSAPIKMEIPMNHRIKTSVTMREFFQLVIELEMDPSEVLELLEDALGADWWDREPEEFALIQTGKPATEGWAQPAPGTIPPGFEPVDASCDFYVGKRMDGNRWEIISEWVPHTNAFSLSFWTTDDDTMTADEVREYAGALLEMGSYIRTMENIVDTGTEEGK